MNQDLLPMLQCFGERSHIGSDLLLMPCWFGPIGSTLHKWAAYPILLS